MQFIKIRSLTAVSALGMVLAGVTAQGQSTFAPTHDPLLPVIGRSQLVGQADPNQVLHVSLSFQTPSLAALQAYADAVSNPDGPSYRSFLTPSQIGAKFGQPTSVVQAAVNYLKAQGFKVTLVTQDNLHIFADGTVSQAEGAFKTTINRYHAINPKEPGRTDYFANTSQPLLPSAIAPKIEHLGGLQSFTAPKPRSLMNPNQARQLYNIAPEFAKGQYGQNRTVAISSWDGFRLSNLTPYYSTFGLPVPAGGVGSNVRVVTIDGGSGAGGPGGEGDLDFQMVLGQAPQTNLIIYDGGFTSGSEPIDVYARELNDNQADIITESYGWDLDSATANAAHTIHLEMTTAGITYMAACGDSGTNFEPFSYPNYEPEVLEVGGTSATVDSSGNRQSEVAWSLDEFGDAGGGGWSTNSASFNTLPSWQVGNGVPTNINFHLNPDVSGHASGAQFFENSSGQAFFAYYIYLDEGSGSFLSQEAGTSAASPIFAGGLAVAEQNLISLGGLPANSAGKQRMGRLQDLIYKQNGRSDVWYDITVGDIGPLPNGTEAVARTGWDFASGWGAINWDAFVKAVIAKPITVTPASAAIYHDPTLGFEGSSSSGGVGQLGTVNGTYYTIGSVASQLGQIAAAQIGINLKSPANLLSLSFQVAVKAPVGVSNFVYLKNWKTGAYDLVNTSSTNGTTQTIKITPQNFATYVTSTGQVVLVDRGVEPSHVSGAAFQLSLDQVVALEGVGP